MNESRYKELAKQFNLTPKEIKEICESQFEFAKDMIQTGDDLTIRLQYLGKFEVKPGRRETVRKRRERIMENRKNEKRDR